MRRGGTITPALLMAAGQRCGQRGRTVAGVAGALSWGFAAVVASHGHSRQRTMGPEFDLDSF